MVGWKPRSAQLIVRKPHISEEIGALFIFDTQPWNENWSCMSRHLSFSPPFITKPNFSQVPVPAVTGNSSKVQRVPEKQNKGKKDEAESSPFCLFCLFGGFGGFFLHLIFLSKRTSCRKRDILQLMKDLWKATPKQIIWLAPLAPSVLTLRCTGCKHTVNIKIMSFIAVQPAKRPFKFIRTWKGFSGLTLF